MHKLKVLFKVLIVFSAIILSSQGCQSPDSQSMQSSEIAEYAIAIHGGAGMLKPNQMGPEMKMRYKAGLEAALSKGEELLKQGVSAVDVVQEVIVIMENDSMFNSGVGAVMTHDLTHELDASIMDGSSLNAGAVAGVRTIKHPIRAARLVMDKSEHVMLAGTGAEEFAFLHGLDSVSNSYFTTRSRRSAVERAIKSEMGMGRLKSKIEREWKLGTVGAVVLDNEGNLAAGTSTGGMTNKKYNRIGDSPIIGAGTYADNESCAVSCTGHGEYFIRLGIAHSVSDAIKLGKMSSAEAGNFALAELTDLGGTGGLIVLDKNGNITFPFNTSCMFRGYALPGKRMVKIFK